MGPDFEGQMRRLRTGDGVYFTKAGARKLAHYVEREIRRYMNNRAVPVALPTGPIGPTSDVKSAVRPIAGPVLPLTVSTGNNDELAGGNDNRPVHSDAIAASVLVKGDSVPAPAGRADDFKWPRESAAPVTAISAAATAAPEPESKPAAKSQIRTDAKADAKATKRQTTRVGPEPRKRLKSSRSRGNRSRHRVRRARWGSSPATHSAFSGKRRR